MVNYGCFMPDNWTVVCVEMILLMKNNEQQFVLQKQNYCTAFFPQNVSLQENPVIMLEFS